MPLHRHSSGTTPMTERALTPRLLLATLVGGFVLLSFAGCSQNLHVGLAGSLKAMPQPLRAGDNYAEPGKTWAYLSFNDRGVLTINDEALELPQAEEMRRLGIRLVDTSYLPPPFRLAHIRDGGIVVASIAKASPLAIAGLRPFDRVRKLNARAYTDVELLAEALANIEPGQRVELSITRAERNMVTAVRAAAEQTVDQPGTSYRYAKGNQRIRAIVPDRLAQGGGFYLPFVTEIHTSRLGHAAAIGPFDALFHYRSAMSDKAISQETAAANLPYGATQTNVGYNTTFEWGTLFGLVKYTRARDIYTHKQHCELKLLWFIPISWS